MREVEMTFGLWLIINISKLLMPLIQTSPEECAERHVFMATSARYAPREGGSSVAGVPVEGDLAVARGSNGKVGSGMYTLDVKCESSPAKVEQLLDTFRNDGTADKVWAHIKGDIIKVTGTEAAL